MHIASIGFGMLLEGIAAKSPAPGGGAVAPAVGALGVSAARMVVSYSIGKKGLEAHEAVLGDAASRLERAQAMLLALADEDAEAFTAYRRARGLAEGAEGRDEAMALAVEAVVRVPLAVVGVCGDVMRLLETLPGRTNPWLASDLAVSARVVSCAAESAVWMVRVNGPEAVERGVAVDPLGEANGVLGGVRERLAVVEEACR